MNVQLEVGVKVCASCSFMQLWEAQRYKVNHTAALGKLPFVWEETTEQVSKMAVKLGREVRELAEGQGQPSCRGNLKEAGVSQAHQSATPGG